MIIYHKNNRRMSNLDQKIQKISRFDVPVLITGETGTGKTLISKYIWSLSKRSKKPFKEINCAGIPETLLEAELFGYVRGAFTGATKTREGLIKCANGGIILLDEIGEMPVNIQTKLLNFIETKKIQPLGSDVEYTVDVRIVAATNVDIPTAIGQNKFRLDLFHRIGVIQLETIPLRNCRSDIPLLCDHLLSQINKELETHINYVESDVYTVLQNYEFEGNIRELKNVLYNAVVMAASEERDEIRVRDLPDRLIEFKEQINMSVSIFEKISLESEKFTINELRQMVEKPYIRNLIINSNFNMTKASIKAGISVPTFKSYLEKYDLINDPEIKGNLNIKETSNESKQNIEESNSQGTSSN